MSAFHPKLTLESPVLQSARYGIAAPGSFSSLIASAFLRRSPKIEAGIILPGRAGNFANFRALEPLRV